jgi:integrase
MSVTRRTWKTADGVQEAWIVRYSTAERDKRGKRRRHIKTFARKKDADAYEAQVKVDVANGVHVPASKSLTVDEAGNNWLAYVKGEQRERTTVDSYDLHLRLYIKPRLGQLRLAELTTPAVEAFRDQLVKDLSRPMARKVLGSLKMLLKDAVRRGHAAYNAAASTRIRTDKRGKRKLKAGEDFPTVQEVGRIINAAPDGKARGLLMVAAFAGLRGSELRGLTWDNVKLRKDGGTITIEQRADRFGKIGAPKSESGHRSIPIGPLVANTLRRLKAKAGSRKLVFGTASDNPENHSNIVQRIFHRAQVEAGITVPVLRPDGKPAKGEDSKTIVSARYSGLHLLRHFAASNMLHKREYGGLGLTLKQAQERLGHATLAMTADRYGHLLPVEEDAAGLAAAERHLFAV